MITPADSEVLRLAREWASADERYDKFPRSSAVQLAAIQAAHALECAIRAAYGSNKEKSG